MKKGALLHAPPQYAAAVVAGLAFQTFGPGDWALLIATMTGAVYLFRGLAMLLHWPLFPGYTASLLASVHLVSGLAALVVGVAVTIVIGSLLLGRLRPEAGLFVAAVGMSGLANRAGTVGAFLRTVEKPQVYSVFIGETVMLLAVMGLAWQVVAVLRRVGWVLTIAEDPDVDLHPSIARLALAAAAQAVITALLVHVLAQNDSLKQAMAAVVVAALVGGFVAHQLVPLPTSVPFWVGPFLAAIGGYAWAHRSPGEWRIGMEPDPLAGITPLAYASLGTAGAIFGYWMSRKWRSMDSDEEFLPEDAVD